jgi:hypothetical protein
VDDRLEAEEISRGDPKDDLNSITNISVLNVIQLIRKCFLDYHSIVWQNHLHHVTQAEHMLAFRQSK